MVVGLTLTTAEILYRMPDFRELLQTYVWQDYDTPPEFPRLKEFLYYWSTNLDGPIVRVEVAHKELITPTEIRILH